MKAKRRLKRGILGCALLTIFSVLLMLGSTMAWFQDSEVVINTYTFGTFDVDIVNGKGESIAGVQPIQFVKPDKGLYNDGEYLFEPGATFQLKEFYIKNNGTVDLKYRLKIDTSRVYDGSDMALLDAMDIYAMIGNERFELETDTGMLAANEKSDPVKIFFHMKESAGNEYQNLAVSGLNVMVLAVQSDGISDDELDTAFLETAAAAESAE